MFGRTYAMLLITVGLSLFGSTAFAHDKALFWFAGTDKKLPVSHDAFWGDLENDSHNGTNDFAEVIPSREPTMTANPWITLNIACDHVWRGWGVWFRADQGLIAICHRMSETTTGAATYIWKN